MPDPKRVESILYVRLPCWKIYPGGVTYVADFIHKQRPGIRQRLLDLAIVPPKERRAVLEKHLREMKPDMVGFSWRNMQSFGPHPEDDALDVVMTYDHSRNLYKRFRAALDATRIIWNYSASRINNVRYMHLVRKLLPESRIVVGGTAVSIFGKYIAGKAPVDTVISVGEGEDTMLSIVDGFTKPVGEFFYKDRQGRVQHRPRSENFDLRQLTAVDFAYVESIFPEFTEYRDFDIGVHTKRGCPLQCHFCLYNKIEGQHQRYREPKEIVDEIEALNKRYGIRRIWFTDAQFCSTKKSIQHVEAILDEIIARDLKISWSGYLRLNHLTPQIADKMIRSGIASVDLSFAGSQEVIDRLTLGYSLEQQMGAFRMIKAAGHTNQKIKLYIPLNAPGETVDTLRETIAKIKELYEMFGRDHVLPFIFFIGVQPGTPVEQLLISQGYLRKGYNPLTLNPFLIKKLLYNPKPLGTIIGRAYLEAVKTMGKNDDYIGRATMDILEEELAKLPAGQSPRTRRTWFAAPAPMRDRS